MTRVYPTRRNVIAGAGAIGLAAMSGPALALTEGEARALVEQTLDELLAMLQTPGDLSVRAPALRKVMEKRANMPLIAKFAAGRVWREMNEDQQARYSDAFSHFVSETYARRFVDFEGDPNIRIGNVIDAGRKGMLVETPLQTPAGETIAVEWLVSDRGGRVEVIDMVVEGISMATTQREEIGAMFDSKGGDVEALISSLKTGS